MIAAATVFLAAQTARTLFPDDRQLQFAVPALVLFWPTQSYMVATINNDNLATLLSAWCALALARLFRQDVSWFTVLALAVGVLLAPYTKRSVFFLVPLILFGGLVYMTFRGLSGLAGQRRRIAEMLLMSAVSVVLLAILMVFLSPAWAMAIAEPIRKIPGEVPLGVGSLLHMIASGTYRLPDRLEFYGESIRFAVKTLWAGFGWGTLLMPKAAYQTMGLVAAVALAGLMLAAWRKVAARERLQPWQTMSLLVFFFASVLFWAQILQVTIVSYPGVHYAPGRYLLTLLIPTSILLVLGLRQWVPRPLHQIFIHVLLATMILFDAVSLVLTIIPFHYG